MYDALLQKELMLIFNVCAEKIFYAQLCKVLILVLVLKTVILPEILSFIYVEIKTT